MARKRKMVALVFSPTIAYSRSIIEGIVERHLTHQEWTIIELPHWMVGQSPLPAGDFHLDGAIIWAEPRDTWVHQLLDQGVRVVNCGKELAHVEGVVSVCFDRADMHRAVLDHLWSLGLRQVVGMGHALAERPATRRVLEDFARAAGVAGMSAHVWDLGGRDSPGTVPQRLLVPEQEHDLATFLASLPLPHAIYCASDQMGFIVCEVAARLGLRVPEDLAIIGQGDNLLASYSHPPLTSVVGPAHQVGRAAADCLNAWFDQGRPPYNSRQFAGATLIPRESTVGKSGSVALEAVRRQIAAQAGRGVTLDALVALSGLSVKTLVRQYRQSFGSDPVADIHRRRIEEIKRLLEQTRSPLRKIAETCGFTTQAALYNYFRLHAKCGPTEYRKSVVAKSVVAKSVVAKSVTVKSVTLKSGLAEGRKV